MSAFRIAKHACAIAGALLVSCSALMAQSSGSAFLKVKAHPTRAGVFVDGKYIGPAANFHMARTYSLPAGKHEIRLVDPRYEDVVTQVELVAGKKTVLSETLKELPPPKGPFGRLRTESADKFAAIYVNGKYMGHADEFSNSSQGLLLPPGEYEVKMEPLSGGSAVVRKVQIEADKTVIFK